MKSRFTWHGGGLAAAMAHFGGERGAWLDLSTGINPRPWPGADTLPVDWQRLPDREDLHLLEETAAGFFGCAPENVCAVPGTEPGLRQIGRLLAAPAFYRAPCYSTHAAMIAGATPLPHSRLAEADGATLILANPNNPDGTLCSRAEMRSLLANRGKNGWLVVDEAFAECHPEASMAAEVRDDRRLVVTRSFGKFFGLAGVRLGFLLGPQALIAKCREMLGAWPLSAAAIRIGTAAYQDKAWITAEQARLAAEATTLDSLLWQCGFPPEGTCPLFRLIRCADAHQLFEHLAKQAILTRPFADNPHWLRIGLPGDAPSYERLHKALQHG